MDVYTLGKVNYIREEKMIAIYLDRATTLTRVEKGAFHIGLYSINISDLKIRPTINQLGDCVVQVSIRSNICRILSTELQKGQHCVTN